MKIKLNRPICFFDLETTGGNVGKDRIVEIAILRVDVDKKESKRVWRVNPEMEISFQAIEVHGITNEMIKNEPNFAHYSNEIYQFLKGCDLAGFNSIRFDIPILVEELIRANVEFDFTQIRMIDSQVIFHKKEPRNLSAALQFYCNKELKNAHSAMDDTIATYEVFKAQIEKYDDLESDMDFLNKYSNRYLTFTNNQVINQKFTDSEIETLKNIANDVLNSEKIETKETFPNKDISLESVSPNGKNNTETRIDVREKLDNIKSLVSDFGKSFATDIVKSDEVLLEEFSDLASPEMIAFELNHSFKKKKEFTTKIKKESLSYNDLPVIPFIAPRTKKLKIINFTKKLDLEISQLVNVFKSLNLSPDNINLEEIEDYLKNF